MGSVLETEVSENSEMNLKAKRQMITQNYTQNSLLVLVDIIQTLHFITYSYHILVYITPSPKEGRKIVLYSSL